ncbi:uncharacterized protein LOC132557674 [Ylistrum balloti]|uniref:uncharacterized protein LOC132557674 n=1 Tax=Ylistrum balloti TaxID=509963 RepID=UPI0029058632|nr:uncharacterized protein LOC132557674 [Ylistrum balloti]
MAIWGVVRLVFTLYVIISPSRFEVATSSRQDPDKWPPEAAVDGNVQNNDVDFCAHTRVKNATKAWWRVDLGHKTTIINITIYYRGKSITSTSVKSQLHNILLGEFAGYQIYVSNSTKRSRAKLCFKDTSTSLEEVKNIISHQCQYVARYVMIYNFRNEEKDHSWYSKSAVLELCEVQVFACVPGKHGDVCENDCSYNCKDKTCIQENGNCVGCVRGKQGLQCTKNCSINCTECKQDDGICTGKIMPSTINVFLENTGLSVSWSALKIATTPYVIKQRAFVEVGGFYCLEIPFVMRERKSLLDL